MNSNESLVTKEHKEPAFKSAAVRIGPAGSPKSTKDITALGSPSSVKVFPPVHTVSKPRPVCDEQKEDSYRHSPIGSPATSTREETYTKITRIGKLDSTSCPMCRQEALQSRAVQPPQTSTPKQRSSIHQGTKCPPNCHGKSVHFAPVVLSPIAPGSPPGYRPPPVGCCGKPEEFIETRLVKLPENDSSLQEVSPEDVTDPTIVPDDSILRQYLTLEVDSCLTKGTAVHHWLKDIRLVTELECLSVLQAKSLATDQSKMAALAVQTARSNITALRNRSDVLLVDFKNTLSALRVRPWAQFCSEATQLIAALREMLREFRSGSPLILETTKPEIRLKRASEDLSEFIQRNRDHWVSEERKQSTKQILKSMQDCFKELCEHLMVQELKVILEALGGAEQEENLKVALAAITSLAHAGEDVCELIAKAGGVTALLAVCTENKWQKLKAATLRALTIVCCMPSAIQQLEESGGIECITAALCEPSQDESNRSEAAGLLAQITAPWMECQSQTFGRIMKSLDPMVKALTHMAWKTDSSEVLLLSSAALANLSFLDKEACKWLSRYDTPRVLVEACRNNHESIFIKDQVSTVLANMAAMDSCRSSLICGNAAVLLLCFLQVRPSPMHSVPELEACERLQQKSAIALARLCTESKMASTIAAMQGVKRLVRLCKDEKERNNSDSVLVAALAALRKISNACGLDEFKTLHAEDLVVPPLWDSFRIYCSKQESYV